MRLLKLLLESAVSEINNEDTHFAIEKSSGKIVRSWDFKDIGDPDTKLMIEDIIDQFPDRNPSEFSILTRRTLKNRNINVNDTNNWLKESLGEVKKAKKKPFAGLSKEQKSAVAKKARAGGDIGKKGKGFEDVAAKAAKQYGSEEAGKRVAAAAMWKNIKREGYNESEHEDEPEDHEVSMAMNSLKSIINSAYMLMEKLGSEERNIPGWIQDHITNAENYIDQAAQGFHELEGGEDEDDEDTQYMTEKKSA